MRPPASQQKRLIQEIKMVLRVLVLYIPLPMFWALFDQQVGANALATRTSTAVLAVTAGVSVRRALAGPSRLPG